MSDAPAEVALLLRADAQAVARALEELLLPDSAAVVTALEGGWVSVHAEQLSEDLADIEELAAPLSAQFGTVWARATLIHQFDAGKHVATAHEAPSTLPLETDGGAVIHVLREAEKPGLAAFFGRSADE